VVLTEAVHESPHPGMGVSGLVFFFASHCQFAQRSNDKVGTNGARVMRSTAFPGRHVTSPGMAAPSWHVPDPNGETRIDFLTDPVSFIWAHAKESQLIAVEAYASFWRPSRFRVVGDAHKNDVIGAGHGGAACSIRWFPNADARNREQSGSRSRSRSRSRR
jgi:hypothetical protein